MQWCSARDQGAGHRQVEAIESTRTESIVRVRRPTRHNRRLPRRTRSPSPLPERDRAGSSGWLFLRTLVSVCRAWHTEEAGE